MHIYILRLEPYWNELMGFWAKCWTGWRVMDGWYPLGTGGHTKTDELSRKFQTTFDPLIIILKNHVAFSFVKFHAQKALFKGPKTATLSFGLKMTPPPFGSFPFWYPDSSLNAILAPATHSPSHDNNKKSCSALEMSFVLFTIFVLYVFQKASWQNKTFEVKLKIVKVKVGAEFNWEKEHSWAISKQHLCCADASFRAYRTHIKRQSWKMPPCF